MEKVAVQSTEIPLTSDHWNFKKSVISLKCGKIERKLVLTAYVKSYKVSISTKRNEQLPACTLLIEFTAALHGFPARAQFSCIISPTSSDRAQASVVTSCNFYTADMLTISFTDRRHAVHRMPLWITLHTTTQYPFNRLTSILLHTK